MQRLQRSSQQRLFLGVCGGIAERYGWDPAWVRIAFVLGVLAGGPGLVLYAVMALVVPSQNTLSGTRTRALPSAGLR